MIMPHQARRCWLSALAVAALIALAGCRTVPDRDRTAATTLPLSCPRIAAALSIDSIESPPAAAQAAAQTWQSLLNQAVRPDDRIDYRFLADDPCNIRALDCYLTEWAPLTLGPDPNATAALPPTGREHLAALINLYNAAVVRAVLEFYPFKKLSDCEYDFMDRVYVPLLGCNLSLNNLARRCRSADDWRVEFALSQPVMTGPILAAELYHGPQLDAQLDRAFLDYLCSCAGLRLDHARKCVLFGEFIYQRRAFFIERYPGLFRAPYVPTEPVSLLTALMPHATPATQQALATVIGYQAALLPVDDRLNDMKRHQWMRIRATDAPVESDYPCGLK